MRRLSDYRCSFNGKFYTIQVQVLFFELVAYFIFFFQIARAWEIAIRQALMPVVQASVPEDSNAALGGRAKVRPFSVHLQSKLLNLLS